MNNIILINLTQEYKFALSSKDLFQAIILRRILLRVLRLFSNTPFSSSFKKKSKKHMKNKRASTKRPIKRV